MNLTDGLLGNGWAIFGAVAFILMLGWAVFTAPWAKIKGDVAAQSVFLGAVLVIVVLWQLSASINPGISFHFLLMTVFTLMFGPQFAILAMTLALLVLTFNGDAGWTMFGLNALIMGWIPIMITWWLYKLAYRFLDRNFFVYIFLNGFLAGGVGALVALVVAGLILLFGGAYSADYLAYNFFPFIPLVAAPEAFLNGFIMAALVVMKPEWVATFSDVDYLKGK